MNYQNIVPSNVRRSDNSVVNTADGIKDDGSQNVRLLGMTHQLPDFNTGLLAVGAAILEPTWNDTEGYKNIIVTSAEGSGASSSWYVEHQFNDMDSGSKFNFVGAPQNANTTQGGASIELRLRYYKNYVRNNDTVPRSFILKRRAVI